MQQDRENHWEAIYTSKSDDTLSWHQPMLSVSHGLIRQFAQPGSSVIDIGGGSSTLAGTLVAEGFSPCAVLDISKTALDRAKQRLEPSVRNKLDWHVVDLLSQPELPAFDVWHDRAVFHFMVEPGQRAAYIALAARTVPPKGILVLGTFHLDGPQKCSGLPVQRYDAESLAKQFDNCFELRKEVREIHNTPWGAPQHFQYVVMERR